MPLNQDTADSIAGAIGVVTPFVAPINPLIPLGLTMLAILIKEEPRLEAIFRGLFSSGAVVTAADIEAAIEHVKSQTYAKSVPDSKLPAEELASTPFPTPSQPSPEQPPTP